MSDLDPREERESRPSILDALDRPERPLPPSEAPAPRDSRPSALDLVVTSGRALRRRFDPTLTAFRAPARLTLGSLRAALRFDRRAQAGAAIFAALAALVAYAASTSPPVGHASEALIGPGLAHPLGTDEAGRDLLAALVAGSLPTLTTAAVSGLAATALGYALGVLAGFARGATDVLIQRLVEAITAVPLLLLVLIAQALVPTPSEGSLVLVVVCTAWAQVAQVIRADVLRVVQLDYVSAARALGASPARVLARHVLPAAFGSAAVLGSFGVGAIVVVETAIAVVGVGHTHPLAWGALLGQARQHPSAWWLVCFPVVLVALTLWATVLLGEAIRDIVDPRLRFRER